jgi:di/tricarboxylate transporter
MSADVVALLAVLGLLLTGALQTGEALAGFGSPAVITIAAIFLVTEGLSATGIAAWMGRRLLQVAGASEGRLIGVTMSASALLSLVMNNIASVSVLLPGVSSVSRQTRISASKLMIPLSFGSLLGGMATLFTTINIIANDSLRSRGLAPFTMWDYFRIGSILTAAGVAFMATLGHRLLPRQGMQGLAPDRQLPGDLAQRYHVPERVFEARILAGSTLDGATLGSSRLGEAFHLNIVGIIRAGRLKLAPGPTEILRAGDRLLVEGEDVQLHETRESLGLVIDEAGTGQAVQWVDRNIGIVEVVVSPYADIVGQSLRDIHFREKFGLTVLALRREGQPAAGNISEMPLRFGDALLLHGPRSQARLLRSERNFIVLNAPDDMDEIVRPDKAPWAIAGVLLMVIPASLGILRIATAALLGAMTMVLSGAVKIEDGYRAIEWKAVVLIGGMLAVGTAMQKSGAAELISHNLLHAFAPFGPTAIVAGFYLVSMLLAQAMSGTAAAVFTAPIALSAAGQAHISPYPLIMMVVLGASTAFMTPVSHPANIMVMGPGGYKFTDYGRVGGLLTLLIFAIALVLVPWFWPF